MYDNINDRSDNIINGINEQNIDSTINEINNVEFNIRRIFVDIFKIVDGTKTNFISKDGDDFRSKFKSLDHDCDSVLLNINTIKDDLKKVKINYIERNAQNISKINE